LLHFWLGEYHPNPNPNIKRRVYERINGKIVYAVDCKKHRVLWDDGRISELFSNCLSKELSSAALPQDQPPSHQQNNPELPPYGQAPMDEEEEEIQEAQCDQEEIEHLPDHKEAQGHLSEDEADDEINNVDKEKGGDESGTARGMNDKKEAERELS
jgi:hypothetical protein